MDDLVHQDEFTIGTLTISNLAGPNHTLEVDLAQSGVMLGRKLGISCLQSPLLRLDMPPSVVGLDREHD